MRTRSRPALKPALKLNGRYDTKAGLHAGMAKAAYLGAEDGVNAGCDRGEMDMENLAGNGILFEAHRWNEEAMNDILRAEGEIDLMVYRQDQLTGDNIVLAMFVSWIEAKRITRSRCDDLWPSVAEGRVGAGISEVPLELSSGNFDLHGTGRRAFKAVACPEVLGRDGHGEVEQTEECNGDCLQSRRCRNGACFRPAKEHGEE